MNIFIFLENKMGLRLRKKEQRERRIMDAAITLFTKQGFSTTSMEQIAERADVGVGTVYNYFKNKNALLVAIFDEEHQNALSLIKAITNDPPEDPVDGILSVFFSYDTWEKHNKAIMRELFAVTFLEMDGMGREFMKMDMEIIGHLGVLLTEYQKRRAIADSVNVQEAVILVYGVFSIQLIMYVAMDDMTLDMLKDVSRRQFELLMKGLIPRQPSRVSLKNKRK